MANERTPIYANNSGVIPDSFLPTNLANTSTAQTFTNKTLSGANNTITNIPLDTGVTGVLPLANGGTGSATQNFVDLTSNQTNIAGSKTFTGLVSVNRTAAVASFAISGDAGQERRLAFRTGGADRWRLTANVATESGSNVGSDLVLTAMNDAGNSLFTIYNINRSTGLTEYYYPIRFATATNPGLIVNSLTTTQRDALTGVSNGTIIYNTTTNKTQFREAGAWIDSGTGTGGGSSTTVFADNTFRVQDNGDATKQLAFEVSGVATATTRTLTVPNVDGVIALKPTFMKDVASAGAVTVTGEVSKNYKFKPTTPLTANRTITLSTTGAVADTVISFSFADMVSADFSTFSYTITDTGATFTQNVNAATRFSYIWSGTAWEYFG